MEKSLGKALQAVQVVWKGKIAILTGPTCTKTACTLTVFEKNS